MHVMIELKDVVKDFGTGRTCRRVLYDLSLTVRAGEVFGFLGPNGAGKSTAIKILLGFLRADRGTLAVKGRKIGQDEYRQAIGYLPELPFFYGHLTARETLMFSGRLSGRKKKIVRTRIPELLERMDLTSAVDQRVGSFSKGMKQRLGMANALIHDPDVLILDEPMSGLDPLGRHLMKDLIFDLKSQGKTIFFSSHILSDIEELCDHIGLIHHGHLLYEGDLPTFLQGGDIETRFVNTIKEWDELHVE